MNRVRPIIATRRKNVRPPMQRSRVLDDVIRTFAEAWSTVGDVPICDRSSAAKELIEGLGRPGRRGLRR